MKEVFYKVICPKCGKEAPWVENKMRYGRNFGKSYMCYYCSPCGTYVGCHQNTRKPLGTMADNYTIKLRRNAHHNFDKIWKSGKVSRKEAYRLLKEKFGIEHFGEQSAETLKDIINKIDLLLC